MNDDHSQKTGQQPDEKEMELLRDLLLLPEQHRLEDLESRFMEPKRLAGYMKDALPKAVNLGRDEEPNQLAGSLKPVIENILDKSVKQNPATMSEILTPVIGSAVSKAVKQAFERTMETINASMETSLSWRSLKWRYEAWRTGKPYSEVVIYHTLIYRVEQAFLVHKETGALLCHVSSGMDSVGDSDLVSSMFTAIADFVKDSFKVNDQAPLQSMRVSDLDVWLESGKHAYLALVIRGNVPVSLRMLMSRILNEVHSQYVDDLEKFNGNTEPFNACYGLLTQCMRSRRRQPAPPKGLLYVAMLLLLGGGLFLGQRFAEHTYNSRLLQEELSQHAGLMLQELESIEGGYRVKGLRDPLAPEMLPLARSAGYAGELEDGTKPFYSLEPEILKKRLRRQLKPLPPGVEIHIRDGNIAVVRGEAPLAFVRNTVRAKVPLGLRKIDTNELYPTGKKPKEAIPEPKQAPKPVASNTELPTTLPEMMDWLSLKNLIFAFNDDPLMDREKNEISQVVTVVQRLEKEARKQKKVLNLSIQAMVPQNDMKMKVQGYSRAKVVKREMEDMGLRKAMIELKPVIADEVVSSTVQDKGVIIFSVSLVDESRAQ